MVPTVISQQLNGEGLYHSQLTQESQGEATPQSTLTTVMRKVCSSVSPHNCRGEEAVPTSHTHRREAVSAVTPQQRRLQQQSPPQQKDAAPLSQIIIVKSRTTVKGLHHLRVTIAGAKGGRTLRDQHSNSKRCRTLVTPQQRGHKIYHSKGP
jgi:hypothetical protein